ncbi:hypothetical protein CP532_1825 [Ophiocordyceps camponoti-leonardi (nom. inval.)]|nr:hypothetical protein CP532_1825 [Ophiocordyceps camponoti-leonardi (nom. inval.)]
MSRPHSSLPDLPAQPPSTPHPLSRPCRAKSMLPSALLEQIDNTLLTTRPFVYVMKPAQLVPAFRA